MNNWTCAECGEHYPKFYNLHQHVVQKHPEHRSHNVKKGYRYR